MRFFKKILFYFFSIVFLFFVYKNCRYNNDWYVACSAPEKVVESMSSLKTNSSDSLNWMTAVQQNISDMEYDIRYFSNRKYHQSPNRANNTRVTYYPQSISIAPRTIEEYEKISPSEFKAERKISKTFEDYTLQIEVKGYGIAEKILHPFRAEKLISENNEAMAQDGHMQVEYINNEQGTRQNFIIQKPVAGNELAVHLTITTTLAANQENENSIVFTGKEQNTKLYYRDLKVWDATGKTLPAQMKLRDEGQEYSLVLAVNTAGALYPITIDPIIVNGTPANANFKTESNQDSAYFGSALCSAGDVNGDGYSDIIVGSFNFDNGQSNEGAAFVYHGNATGISTVASAMVESNQGSAYMGASVAGAGDVNNDGYSDVIVGAYYYDNGQSNEGVFFVYHGSASGINTTPSSMVESNQAGAQMGRYVRGAGDVNGDGYSDVIVGASYYVNGQSNEGAAFVYHGGASGINTNASVVLERDQADSYFGWSVNGAGDVNGDGYSDVVVGAVYYSNGQSQEGAAFVYHGSASGISTTAAAMVESNQAAGYLGWSVSSAGDVNGDGYSDVIVGAVFYTNGQSQEGAAFVYHGSSSGINSTAAVTIQSNQIGANLGRSVEAAGDVNGDGYSDVIVGALYYSNGQSQEGAAFVYHGSSTGINANAVAMIEGNQIGAEMGYAVSSAGDVNGDGYSDILVGAESYNNGQADEGAAFVYFGGASGLSTSSNVIAECNNDASSLGFSVSSAGDVNGDGYQDIIVAAPGYDNNEAAEGAAFIYHGSATGISGTATTILESNQVAAYFGRSVSGAGDVNGDGYSDVVVGAYNYSNVQSGEGAVFVYHGSSSGISTTVAMMAESNNAGWNMGCAVASAGDVNGDGYSDMIAGILDYTNGQTSEGAIYVYYGNSGSIGKRNNVRLYNTDLSTPIQQSNKPNSAFGLGLYTSSFQGKQNVKLIWEVKTQGQPFSSAGGNITNSVSNTSSQGSFSNSGLTGTNLTASVTKPGMQTKVRCRVQYDLVTSVTGQKYGPWRYPQGYLSGQQGMGSTPLPVEWLSFTAQWEKQRESARLNWSTASEKNNSHFTILRSTDGINWEERGTVNGAGTINTVSNYTYIDNGTDKLQGDVVYYRVMQTDFNGQFSLSEIQELTLSKKNQVTVAPVPGNTPIIVLAETPVGNQPYTITNVQGKVVATGVILKGTKQQQLDLTHLPAGVYLLSIQSGKHTETIKLITQ